MEAKLMDYCYCTICTC